MADMEDSREDEPMELVCAAVYLLQADWRCYSCEQMTPMFGLMALPPMREDDDEGLADEDSCVFRDLVDVPDGLAAVVREHSGSLFRPDHSHTAGLTYWMNHCKHCDAKQGDFFVHGPSGPFWPYDESQMDEINATRIEGPFRFEHPNMSYSGAMVAWRNRKHGVVMPKPVPRTARSKRT